MNQKYCAQTTRCGGWGLPRVAVALPLILAVHWLSPSGNHGPHAQAKARKGEEPQETQLELKPVVLDYLVTSIYATQQKAEDGTTISVSGKAATFKRDRTGKLALRLGSDTWTIPGEGTTLSAEIKGCVHHVSVYPDCGGELLVGPGDALAASLPFGDVLFIDADYDGLFFEAGVDWVGIGSRPGMAWVYQTEMPLVDGVYTFSAKDDGKDKRVVTWNCAEFTTTNRARELHNTFNRMRMDFGLFPTLNDTIWDKHCDSHCAYMAIHGIGHPEDVGKQGYSKEGHQAGMASILCSGTTAEQAMLSMLATPLHGLYMRQPWFTRAAFGARESYIAIHKTIKGAPELPWTGPCIFPPNNCRNVPTHWNGAESPDPRQYPDKNYGYPISFFHGWGELFSPAEMTAVLERRDGNTWTCVPSQLTYPSGPVQPASGKSTWTFLMAEDGLQPDTVYRVRASWKCKGKPAKGKAPTQAPAEGQLVSCFKTGSRQSRGDDWATSQQR